MPITPMRLTLPVQCRGCNHPFKIDPIGVQPWTDIICPACSKVDHVDQETVDRFHDEYMDAMGQIYDEEDDFQEAMSLMVDAPDKSVAIIVYAGL